MPPLNFYLDKDAEFPPADEKIIKSKVQGKTLDVELQKRDISNGQVKSSFDLKKPILEWLKSLRMSQAGFMMLKSDGTYDGKIKDVTDYELNVTVNRKRYKCTVALAPTKGLVIEEPEAPQPTYVNNKVKSACSGNNFQAKIKSISLEGKSYKGHGKVEYLGNALHAHVTNTLGLAWEWKGDKMHIVATGKKNNQNKKQARGGTGKNLNTCQYDWDEG